jgi:hypothetical protein
MFIKDYISKDFPCFSLSDSIESARNMLKILDIPIFSSKNPIIFTEHLPKTFFMKKMAELKRSGTSDRAFCDSGRQQYYGQYPSVLYIHSNVIPVINKNEKYLGILPVMIFFRICPNIPCFQKQELSLR